MTSTPTTEWPLKESIRDMIRFQRHFYLPDELFWEIFDARVLLNEPVDIERFIEDPSVHLV